MVDDDGSALAKLQRLVRDRTRFDASDVQGVAESCVPQGMCVDAMHRLEALVRCVEVTGRSQPTAYETRSSTRVMTDAESDSGARLTLGLDLLYKKLQDASTAYDELHEGIWLPAEAIHVELHRCIPCHGRGCVTCHTCSGNCTERCYSCGGGGQTNCHWCSCTGKVTCPQCYGTSYVIRGRTEYYTEQVWVVDRYEYQSKSRWVEERVSCSCTCGRVDCSHCAGQGKIRCATCHATGTITCRTCAGAGDLTCNPCEGSGQVGTAAWVEVYHTVEYGQGWFSPVDPRADDIRKEEKLHDIVRESRGLTLNKLHRKEDGMSGLVVAGYRGELDIRHLDAACREKTYHVVTYGVNRQWLDLNHILRDLLNGDLEALRSALVLADTSGHSKQCKENLTTPLRDVVNSEINTALVDAVLDSQPLDELHTLVSADYAEKLKNALLSALKRIYDGVAMRTWWQAPLTCGLLGLAAWGLKHPYWAVLPGICTLPMSLGILRFQSVRVFTSALGDRPKAKKAVEHVRKAKHHRKGLWLHLLPSLAVLALAATGAAHQYTLDRNAPTAPIFAIPLAGDAPSREAASPGNAQDYLSRARSLWEKSTREPAPASENDRLAATDWALKAVNASPEDNDALLLAGQLTTMEGQSPVAVTKGVTMLKKAASKGSGEAMHILGLMYIMGSQIPKDAGQARHWFTEAANTGRASDMYNLGLMDWRGEGMSATDKDRARQWWNKAAARGDSRAKQALAQGGPGGH